MRAAQEAVAGPAPIDPRILTTHVERGARAAASTALGSPPWICLTAFLCSKLVGLFGNVGLPGAFAAVSVVVSASLAVQITLYHFDGDASHSADVDAGKIWLRRLLTLDVLMSTVWGLVPWLLWQEGSLANHLFIELMSLSVVARFLVSRAGHMDFFIASFGPMAVLLFGRLIADFQTGDLILAGLVPLYALHLVLDARRHAGRIDSDAVLRFVNEDLARELEEARDEALRKRTEAEAANASKTSFLANMSHELRTPLNAILGFSEIIARECLGPVGSPRYKEYAGDIHGSGTHLLSLINDLLDVAKIESGKMEIEPNMIETTRMLEHALKLVGVRAKERKQSLSITVAPEAEILFADERALKQIVINLASNAVKFTPECGCIEVSARHDRNGDFELLVEDNGPGIPKEKLDHIFKPFAQIDNRYDRKAGGTGLGLSLVRGLAELHGGRAWIESNPERGTRAYVVLPRIQESAKRRTSA